MTKLKGTIKFKKPLSGNPKSNSDYNFVFSSDIKDWSGSKYKKEKLNRDDNNKKSKSYPLIKYKSTSFKATY